MLVTLQNGMGNAEVLMEVPDAVVVRGVTMNAGRYVEPGCVENLIEGKTWLGPQRGSVEAIKPLAELLTAAGYPTEVLADPMGAVWSKFVFNCVMNPLGALMMGDNAARHNSPEMRALIDDMAAECMAVIEGARRQLRVSADGIRRKDPLRRNPDVQACRLDGARHRPRRADRNRRVDRLHRRRGRTHRDTDAELPGGLSAG